MKRDGAGLVMSEKVLIIGWDGATWDYIEPLLQEGQMPHLQALLARGARAVLRSTIPPYTNIAWPSLITGLSPAQTGIFDGAKLAPHTYSRRPTNLAGYRGAPLWHWANRFGRRAGVLNVPMTYPAQPLDGYLVGGFDTPRHAADATWPRDLLDRWRRRGLHYDILSHELDLIAQQNPHQPRGDLDTFVAEWIRITERQGDLTAWLWQNEPTDLQFVVFTATDSINHRTRDRRRIERVYKAADRALGRILSGVTEDTLVCLVSDHGSTPAQRYIALSRALADAGWIVFRPEVAARFWSRLPGPAGRVAGRVWPRLPTALRQILSRPLLRRDRRLAAGYENIDWARTQVYALTGMGPLYINLQGRQPQGIVPAHAYEGLRTQVRDYFLALQDGAGQPLFADVLPGEGVYPHADPADMPPDLVLVPARWSDHIITGFPSDPLVRPIPAAREYGTHTPEGIFVLAGPNVRAGIHLSDANITDVTPTLLAAWGAPLPRGVDGQVLVDVFTNPPPLTYVEDDRRQAGATDMTASAEILERLRSLGYLE